MDSHRLCQHSAVTAMRYSICFLSPYSQQLCALAFFLWGRKYDFWIISVVHMFVLDQRQVERKSALKRLLFLYIRLTQVFIQFPVVLNTETDTEHHLFYSLSLYVGTFFFLHTQNAVAFFWPIPNKWNWKQRGQ